MSDDALRQEILALVGRYAGEAFPQRAFVSGETPVPVSGKVFGAEEVRSLVDSALDFWLTAGRYADEFERGLERFVGRKHASLCNSGSSANLLAVSALTSPRLGERRLRPGDEVLTVAAAFPTTVAPIVQCGLVPVFLDVDVGTYNVDVSRLAEAVGPRTRAIVLAHTLGNPFDLDAVMAVARARGLWVVEDTCDALGSLYGGKMVGSFGDLATLSFYPAHHCTTGQGGCVLTDSSVLRAVINSFRAWGRSCWCRAGEDNTCGKRFDWQLGDLPHGFDHKYISDHIGYNLEMTDMQAAVGAAQLRRLEDFGRARRRNFARLLVGLRDLEHLFVLPVATKGSDPSWFGFPLTVREGVLRQDVVRHLESHKIATRMLFAGNILRQPAFREIPHRVARDLANTDRVMRDTFWIGVYPGITDEMVDYVVSVMHDFKPPRRLA